MASDCLSTGVEAHELPEVVARDGDHVLVFRLEQLDQLTSVRRGGTDVTSTSPKTTNRRNLQDKRLLRELGTPKVCILQDKGVVGIQPIGLARKLRVCCTYLHLFLILFEIVAGVEEFNSSIRLFF